MSVWKKMKNWEKTKIRKSLYIYKDCLPRVEMAADPTFPYSPWLSRIVQVQAQVFCFTNGSHQAFYSVAIDLPGPFLQSLKVKLSWMLKWLEFLIFRRFMEFSMSAFLSLQQLLGWIWDETTWRWDLRGWGVETLATIIAVACCLISLVLHFNLGQFLRYHL